MGNVSILIGSPKIKKTERLIDALIGRPQSAIFCSDKTVDRFRLFYDKSIKRPKEMRFRGIRFDLSGVLVTNDVQELARFQPATILITDFPLLSEWHNRIFDSLKKVSFISAVLRSDLLIEVTTSDDVSTHEMGARISALLEKERVPYTHDLVFGLKRAAVMLKFDSSDLLEGDYRENLAGVLELGGVNFQ